MRSVKYRASGPVASKARAGARSSAPPALDPCPQTQPPELTLDPWDWHGGVYFGKAVDPSAKESIPEYRVVTVGYGYPTPNALDKNTIREAMAALQCALQFKSGKPATTYLGKPYLPTQADIIVINARTEPYLEPDLVIGRWVMLVPEGHDGGVVTIIGGASAPQVIRVEKVSQTGATRPFIQIGGVRPSYISAERLRTFRLEPFVNGSSADSNQRGIDCVEGAELVIEDATFSGFHAFGSGAAIRNFLGTARRCNFENCTVFGDSRIGAKPPAENRTDGGGAISGFHVRGLSDAGVPRPSRRYVYTRADLISCHFTNCVAEYNGGAVRQMGMIDKCTFSGCRAETGSGGACYDVTTVENCRFSGCVAGEAGGALSYIHGWVDANVLQTTEGKADFNGTYFVRSCRIEECEAPRGGAIAECEVDISDCFIDHNTATGRGGGGLYRVGGGRYLETDNSYEKTGHIDRCSITRNSAVAGRRDKRTPGDQMGGGLHSCSGDITNCIVAANHAGADGGGLFNCDGALRHLDILGNKADGLGGGARDCRGKIQNSIILGNWSLDSRGDNGNSNQLSKCSDPKHCFLPGAWVGDRSTNAGNVFDDGKGPGGKGPGFVTAGLPAEPNRGVDPTTLDDFAILDTYDARRLRLTSTSKALRGGKNFGVKADLRLKRDFDNHERPNPAAEDPDIGVYEYPPQ